MKIGRNAPCPCGSGKKYKHCCMDADGQRARMGDREQKAGARTQGDIGIDEIKRMMAEQAGFSSVAELDAAMREFEAYCEKLPDDIPAPTFMEYLGRANRATQFQKSLADDAGNRVFSDREEVQEYLNKRMQQENESPVDDFEGLTPAEMHSILNGTMRDNEWLVTVSDDLTAGAALSADIIIIMRFVLEYHVDHGGEIRLTSRGNFPKNLCRSYLEKHDHRYRRGDPVPIELNIRELFSAHETLLDMGYIDESADKSWITTEGVGVLSGRQWARAFKDVLRYVLDEADWIYWLDEALQIEHFQIVQRAALFLLYLLKQHPEGTVAEYFDRFIRAFPAFAEPAQGEERIVAWLGVSFATLFFEYFCSLFGLVSLTANEDDDPIAPDARYEVTDLFRQTFRWKR